MNRECVICGIDSHDERIHHPYSVSGFALAPSIMTISEHRNEIVKRDAKAKEEKERTLQRNIAYLEHIKSKDITPVVLASTRESYRVAVTNGYAIFTNVLCDICGTVLYKDEGITNVLNSLYNFNMVSVFCIGCGTMEKLEKI